MVVNVFKRVVKPKRISIQPSDIVNRMKKGYGKLQQERYPQQPLQQSVQYPQGYPVYVQPPPPQPTEPAETSEQAKQAKEQTKEQTETGGHVKEGIREKIGRGVRIRSDIKDVPKPLERVPESEDLRGINTKYALIPRNPRRGEYVFAYAHIKWDRKAGHLVYSVIEPALTSSDREAIETAKRILEERLDVDFYKLGQIKAKSLLREEVRRILDLNPSLTEGKKTILSYYIERDIIGLGSIDPLMNDSNIEDISCDGIGIPIYVYHRNPRMGSIMTNVSFRTEEELNTFVIKLSQRCRKTISIAEPLIDASLPDGSRVQATLGTDIARRGSNFTIRKFTEEPLTPSHILAYGTIDSTTMAYLWLAVENGQSILISGGTATGKTSLLNALSLFIRPNMKIVSIEDTPELRLPHPHWIPEVARTALSIKGSVGEVTLFDLLKSSLRQRPDYIVMGEVRGKEAFVLFQQMASIPGEEKVLLLNDNHLKKIEISKVENGRKYRVPTFEPETGKFKISELKMMVEHAPVDELYRITTRKGREVVVTKNHSLFTFSGSIEPIVVSGLKEGDKIAIPAKLPFGYNDISHLNLLELLPDIRVYSPELIRKASRKLSFEKASKIAGFTTISNYYGVNNCALPAKSFKRLMEEAEIKYHPDDIEVRFERGKSPKSSAALEITPELLRLFGYYISEGSLNRARKNNAISLYNKDKLIIDDMRRCIKKVTGKKAKERETYGFGSSTELRFSNKTLFELLKKYCGQGSENMKVPDFIHGLSRERIANFLSGLYSGDSYVGETLFAYYTISKELANDISNLLLTFGIVPTIRKRKRKGRKTTDYEIVFGRFDDRKIFLDHVKPIGKNHVLRGEGKPDKNVLGEIYMDEIKKIERIKTEKPVPVYDLSVPGTQNFIGGFGGVLLHNTGHPSIATIHAASISQLIDRLTTPPISLPPTLIENVNIVIFLVLSRYRGKYIRRADSIMEIRGMEGEKPITRDVFRWNPMKDDFAVRSDSTVLSTIAARQGMTDEQISEELLRRRMILEWMIEQGIYDYREVSRVISSYYSDPENLMSLIRDG